MNITPPDPPWRPTFFTFPHARPPFVLPSFVRALLESDHPNPPGAPRLRPFELRATFTPHILVDAILGPDQSPWRPTFSHFHAHLPPIIHLSLRCTLPDLCFSFTRVKLPRKIGGGRRAPQGEGEAPRSYRVMALVPLADRKTSP